MRTLKRFNTSGEVVSEMPRTDHIICIAFEPQDTIDIETPIKAIGGMTVYLFDSTHARPYLFDEELTQAIEDRLKELSFDPSKHRLILSGHMVAVAAMVSVVAADHGWFTALAFDTKIKAYREMIMG